ncbi:MAG: DMT family transporter [candidate division Zixibacteria bacterium]|nr:DMT family transporter [candidate division Zixibacteria bacterium]
MTRLTKYSLLTIAILAVSWSAIFIRIADADPISTAFYRMAFAVVILIPIGGRGLIKSLQKLSRLDCALIIISGIVLGLHFASWISSLKHTTIANSVIIVSTQPFFVAVAEAVIWKTKISKGVILGMVAAFIGMILISGIGSGIGAGSLLGEFLALIGAVCAGAYLIIGRKLRQNLKNRHYILSVYSIAAITLLIIAGFTSAPLSDFSDTTWIMFVLLALIPTVIGHSLYNYLLKYLKAHIVGLTILGEPIGAIVLAALIFGEYPAVTAVVGGALILIGIALALFAKKSDNKRLETA